MVIDLSLSLRNKQATWIDSSLFLSIALETSHKYTKKIHEKHHPRIKKKRIFGFWMAVDGALMVRFCAL